MRRIVYFILFLSITNLSAQLNEGFYDDLVFLMNNTDSRYTNIEGTPYSTEEFVPAIINDINKKVLIRLNTFDNMIELKKPNGDILSLSQSHNYRIKLFDGTNKEYETHSYGGDNRKSKTTFFEKIYDGEMFKLYKKENIKLIPKKIATSGYEQDIPAKFVRGISIYYSNDFKSESTGLVEIPAKRKDISNFFEDKSKSMQQFIKKQKLKPDNKEDLIKIFNFYFSQK